MAVRIGTMTGATEVHMKGESMGRRLKEVIEIVLGNQTILLNSKEEFLQGAVFSTRTPRGFSQ